MIEIKGKHGTCPQRICSWSAWRPVVEKREVQRRKVEPDVWHRWLRSTLSLNSEKAEEVWIRD